MVLLVIIREGQLLLALRRGIGVIEVKHQGGGRLWGAGDEGVAQHAREPGESLAVDAVCKPGTGRGTRQVLRGLQGRPLPTALQQGGVPETMGLIAICRPRSDVGETLGQEGPALVLYIGLMSLVLHSGGEVFGEANLAVDATQHEGTTVG
jgi:hypothetical protein